MQGFSAISLINSTDGEEILLFNARLQNVIVKIKTLLVICCSEKNGIMQQIENI